jgi:hypothetical protein
VVARQEGFADHREMAEYMKTKGYEWNVHKNNYVKTVGRIEECLPFIRFLYEKRDDLYQLLFGTREDGKIPRYAELSH